MYVCFFVVNLSFMLLLFFFFFFFNFTLYFSFLFFYFHSFYYHRFSNTQNFIYKAFLVHFCLLSVHVCLFLLRKIILKHNQKKPTLKTQKEWQVWVGLEMQLQCHKVCFSNFLFEKSIVWSFWFLIRLYFFLLFFWFKNQWGENWVKRILIHCLFNFSSFLLFFFLFKLLQKKSNKTKIRYFFFQTVILEINMPTVPDFRNLIPGENCLTHLIWFAF